MTFFDKAVTRQPPYFSVILFYDDRQICIILLFQILELRIDVANRSTINYRVILSNCNYKINHAGQIMAAAHSKFKSEKAIGAAAHPAALFTKPVDLPSLQTRLEKSALTIDQVKKKLIANFSEMDSQELVNVPRIGRVPRSKTKVFLVHRIGVSHFFVVGIEIRIVSEYERARQLGDYRDKRELQLFSVENNAEGHLNCQFIRVIKPLVGGDRAYSIGSRIIILSETFYRTKEDVELQFHDVSQTGLQLIGTKKISGEKEALYVDLLPVFNSDLFLLRIVQKVDYPGPNWSEQLSVQLCHSNGISFRRIVPIINNGHFEIDYDRDRFSIKHKYHVSPGGQVFYTIRGSLYVFDLMTHSSHDAYFHVPGYLYRIDAERKMRLMELDSLSKPRRPEFSDWEKVYCQRIIDKFSGNPYPQPLLRMIVAYSGAIVELDNFPIRECPLTSPVATILQQINSLLKVGIPDVDDSEKDNCRTLLFALKEKILFQGDKTLTQIVHEIEEQFPLLNIKPVYLTTRESPFGTPKKVEVTPRDRSPACIQLRHVLSECCEFDRAAYGPKEEIKADVFESRICP